jgi:hypothetical protein
MPRAQISWRVVLENGERGEVYAEHIGDQWRFFFREGRRGEWSPYPTPTLDDWLELLDGVRRRIPRRWFKPEEEFRLIKIILDHFPDAPLELPPGFVR